MDQLCNIIRGSIFLYERSLKCPGTLIALPDSVFVFLGDERVVERKFVNDLIVLRRPIALLGQSEGFLEGGSLLLFWLLFLCDYRSSPPILSSVRCFSFSPSSVAVPRSRNFVLTLIWSIIVVSNA